MKRLLLVAVVGSLFLLSSLSPVLGQVKPLKKTPELLSEGKKNFEQICSPCHGSKGDGKGAAGAVLVPAPTNFTKALREWPNTKGDPQKIFEVISKGIPNSGMIAWTQFSEKERWGLTYYVMDFATPLKATPAKKTK